AVRAQQLELLPGAVPRLAGLPLGDRRAQDDVAEQPRVGLVVLVVAGHVAGAQLVHGEGQHVGGAGLVHPLLVQLGHRGLVDQQDRQLRQRVHAHAVQDVPGQVGEGLLVDLDARLVQHLDAHCRPRLRGPRPAASRVNSGTFTSACRLYASTMSVTSLCRTTSRLSSRLKWMSSMPSRISWTTRSPLCCPFGRSTWVTSPVTTIFEPNPSRVRNIFICSGEVFCASSRMMNESFSVRPRMYARGATSMVPDAISRGIESGSTMSCRES